MICVKHIKIEILLNFIIPKYKEINFSNVESYYS